MPMYYPEVPMAHSVDLFKMNPAVAVRLTDPELMGDCNVVEEFLEALPDYCVKDAADLSESTFNQARSAIKDLFKQAGHVWKKESKFQ